MSATHEDRPVEILRDATPSDPDFDPATPKVVIKLEDGSEKTVPRSEVTYAPVTNQTRDPSATDPAA